MTSSQSATSTAPVLVDHDGPVTWISLNRPDQLNALSGAVRDGLRDALDQIERSPECRVIVVTGVGRAFCAGGDLKEFKEMLAADRRQEMIDSVRGMSATLLRLERSSRPVIAAVNGDAIAGGLEIILCCDLVVASQAARIGDGHLRYGVLPGGGGSVRLMRKVPANVAKHLMLTGEVVPASDMMHWGLVNRVVAPEELLPAVSQLASSLAALSPLALAHIKRLANDSSDRPLEACLEDELSTFGSYLNSHDFHEGIAAFSERRAPRFGGA